MEMKLKSTGEIVDIDLSTYSKNEPYKCCRSYSGKPYLNGDLRLLTTEECRELDEKKGICHNPLSKEACDRIVWCALMHIPMW